MKWLVYTVLVGLIPVLSRFLAWMVTHAGTVEPIAASDFIAFGLVLHVSTINEMEQRSNFDPVSRTLYHGSSIVFIWLYGILYTIGLVGEAVVAQPALRSCAITLAFISFLLNYSVYFTSNGEMKEER